MPDIRILNFFNEDELENFLSLDKNLNLEWDSYENMNFFEFELMMRQVLQRIGKTPTPEVEMIITGERDMEAVLRVCFVLRSSFLKATFNEVLPLPVLETPENATLDLLVKEYFPDVKPGWMLWGFTV